MASDFTRDRSFNAIGLRYVYTVPTATSPAAPVELRLDPESAATGFDFTAATRTYRARYNGDTLTIATQPKGVLGFSYDQGDEGDTSFTRTAGFVDVNYVGYVNWIDLSAAAGGSRRTQRLLLFGARTPGSDLPASGARTFNGKASTYTAVPSEGRDATITVDFAARTVSGMVAYQPAATGNAGSGINPIQPVPIAITGVLDPATGRISGTVRFNATDMTGTFEGGLYGPSGAEAGLLFKIARDADASYYGVAITRR